MTILKTTYEKMKDETGIIGVLSEDIDIDFIIQSDDLGDDCIIPDEPVTVVQDLDITFVEGTYCNYNEETNEYEPDFCVTVIYEGTDTDHIDFNDYAYFEQDGPLVTIHNYRNIMANSKEKAA